MAYILTTEQAKVGIVAGMWTEEDLKRARKNPDGFLINGWYLANENLKYDNIPSNR